MRREEAIKAIRGFNDENRISPYNPKFRDALDMAIEALEELPKRRKEAKRWKHKALQAEPVKHGKWEDIGGVIRYGCPFCHYAQEEKSDYCPNCGADMRGEEE